MRALSKIMVVGVFVTLFFAVQYSSDRRKDGSYVQHLLFARDNAGGSKACAMEEPEQPRLQYEFYGETCPFAEFIIRDTVKELVSNSSDVAPALLRLFFHDCFVQGCDGSVLLDSRDGVPSEKEARANKNSLRGFDAIDTIKARVEEVCPLVVSCADIVALAARDAIFFIGGPFYPLRTGRRDSTVSRAITAEAQLPSPFATLDAILSAFRERGFDQNETITLLGGHTIGHTHCRFFQSRLSNFSGDGVPDPTMNSTLTESLRVICEDEEDFGGIKVPMDLGSHNSFDNHFYKNIVAGYGVLYADQQLMASPSTASLVVDYAAKPDLFRREFARAMVKLSEVGAMTGLLGEVRKDCSIPL